MKRCVQCIAIYEKQFYHYGAAHMSRPDTWRGLWAISPSAATVFNPLRPRQNGRHFADDIFKSIFLNENVWIQTKISLKFVPKGPINNIPALVQIMAWRRPGDKPLSEPMMVGLPTRICVGRPQWINMQERISKSWTFVMWDIIGNRNIILFFLNYTVRESDIDIKHQLCCSTILLLEKN